MSSLASGAGRARDGQTSPGQDIPAWSTVSQPIALLPHIFKLLSTGKSQLNRQRNIPWSFASFASTHLQIVLRSFCKHSPIRTSQALIGEAFPSEQQTHRTTSPWSNPIHLLCCPFAFAFTHVHLDVNKLRLPGSGCDICSQSARLPPHHLGQTLALAYVHILTI